MTPRVTTHTRCAHSHPHPSTSSITHTLTHHPHSTHPLSPITHTQHIHTHTHHTHTHPSPTYSPHAHTHTHIHTVQLTGSQSHAETDPSGFVIIPLYRRGCPISRNQPLGEHGEWLLTNYIVQSAPTKPYKCIKPTSSNPGEDAGGTGS